MRRLSAAIGRPVTFAMLQVDPSPDLWERAAGRVAGRVRRRAPTSGPRWPARPTGLLSGHHTSYCLFDHIPAYAGAEGAGPLPRRAVPSAPATLKCGGRSSMGAPRRRHRRDAWRRPTPTTYLLGSPPDYEPGPERSLAAFAAASGSSPLAVAYDAMLEDEGYACCYVPILNYSAGDLEPTLRMLLHPRAALGLADGGAHCGIICDASQPTFMLTHWTRDRTRGERLPIEWVVQQADPRHRPPLRPARPGHDRAGHARPTSTSSTTSTCS